MKYILKIQIQLSAMQYIFYVSLLDMSFWQMETRALRIIMVEESYNGKAEYHLE